MIGSGRRGFGSEAGAWGFDFSDMRILAIPLWNYATIHRNDFTKEFITMNQYPARFLGNFHSTEWKNDRNGADCTSCFSQSSHKNSLKNRWSLCPCR